jgi:hypothetical protein
MDIHGCDTKVRHRKKKKKKKRINANIQQRGRMSRMLQAPVDPDRRGGAEALLKPTARKRELIKTEEEQRRGPSWGGSHTRLRRETQPARSRRLIHRGMAKENACKRVSSGGTMASRRGIARRCDSSGIRDTAETNPPSAMLNNT